jgi:hypothetical protein
MTRFAIALLVLLAACASEEVCAPGIQEECACPDGVPGAQACNEEGSGFGQCICDVGPSGGSGAGNAGGGPAQAEPGQPPPPDGDAPPGDGSAPRSFAVTHLYVGQYAFGSTVESADAWKGFGYDIDHEHTISSFSGHCSPNSGAAPANVFPDGNDGNDNSFGKVLLPIIKTAAATSVTDLEASLNEPIEGGVHTLVFDLPGLGADKSYASVSSSFFEARERSGATWLKGPESFDGAQPALQFPDAYLVDDVWVSGRADGVLTVQFAFGLRLRIHRPLVTAELSADHTTVSRGIISGVLDTEELVEQMRVTLGAVQQSFCDGGAVEGILNQFRQASDIKANGTQGAGTCDGISIGLGFSGEAVSIGGFATPLPPVEDPCTFEK